MIFDDYDNFSENQITLTPNSQFKQNCVTSLDNLIVDGGGICNKNDCNVYYDIYQIHVNKSCFQGLIDLKKQKDLLAKRESIIPVPNKKRRSNNNFFLILTDRKKSLEGSESGIELEGISIEEIKGSENISSERSSVFEKNLNDWSSNKSKLEPSIINQASINNKTFVEEKQPLIDNLRMGFYSLNLKSNRVVNQLVLKKTKSADHIAGLDMNMQINVHLESFVSLDEIVRKPKSMRAEDEICSICSHNYILKDYIARLCTCNHIFHKKCIDEWIKNSDPGNLRCPLCEPSL